MRKLAGLLALALLSGLPGAVAAKQVSGEASYYCNNDLDRARRSDCHYKYPDKVGSTQLYAAAGPPLKKMLGSKWRNKTVTVISASASVKVKLIDSCWCPDRAIDLYFDAFEQLAPLHLGVLDVTIVHDGGASVDRTPNLVALPPTDTEPVVLQAVGSRLIAFCRGWRWSPQR